MMPALAFDPAAYAIGERTPRSVYLPADTAELAELLRRCDAEQRAVVLFGGNTLQTLGFPPERYDAAIGLGRLDRIVEYEHRDLTIAVQAGLGVAALDRALAERGQFVPLDVPRATVATVGGTLAAGWLGPRRAAYGSPRDFLIGTTVVLADGTVAKAGGMVVKNSTGYDVSKLYVGSLGTLGALVRANLKTLPLPRARRVAIAALPEGTRERAVAHVAALENDPAAALLVRGFSHDIEGPEGQEGRLVLLYEGSERLVDAATRALRSALGAAGVPSTRLIDREAPATFSQALDAYVAPLGSRSATYRSFGRPTDLATRTGAFARSASEARLELETIEDLRTGDVIARLSTYPAERLAERLYAFDTARAAELATARVLVAPPALRAHLACWGTTPSSHATMRALKTRFDPKGTLAPGRHVGRL